MHSFLITGGTDEKRHQKTLELCTEQSVSQFDITVIERAEIGQTAGEIKRKASVGIEEVKNMQKTLHLKPFQGEKKAVIIPEAQLLTPEAQNALLKVLEEPPASTIFILESDTKEALLPTILSRCQIIHLTSESIIIIPSERKNIELLIDAIMEKQTGKSLKFAEKFAKNKEEAISWIEKLILIVREQALGEIKKGKHPKPVFVSLLTNSEKTRKQLKTTNVNLRLTIENLFLNA